MADEIITERGRERYARAAVQVQAGERGCCGSGCCGDSQAEDLVTGNLYTPEETAVLPEALSS